MKNMSLNETSVLKERIKNGSALYFYRATPFTEHGEFNYNGALSEEFFFRELFSEKGKCEEYAKKIAQSFNNREHKSILLIGSQGCGKTTFVHYLESKCNNICFKFFDFDKNTSHPTLSEYIEILSGYLHGLLLRNEDTNKMFYDLYIQNQKLIDMKINANNNIKAFFCVFKEVFVDCNEENKEQDEFIKNINNLFFNQILSLIILWHLCAIKRSLQNGIKYVPIVFCLDNLDVLVNKEIIENFFKEYFRFVRNVDSIIQNIEDPFLKKHGIYYNTIFTFIFSCRQHTWARVRQHYRHDNPFVRISTLELDVTDAFE